MAVIKIHNHRCGVNYTLDIDCDLCGFSMYDACDFEGTAQEIRESAKRDGWLRKKVEGKMKDICFNCTNKKSK
jgi:hypothetical protein